MASPTPGRTPPRADFLRRLRSELPRLLREDPALRREVHEALQEFFPTRAEVGELRALREDFNRFADEARGRFEAIDRRFEAIDRRFEAMDRRFEAFREDFNRFVQEALARFEAIGRRFEAMDRRFEAMDRRFNEIVAELRAQRVQVLSLSRLAGRLGRGVEYLVRGVVEEFAGKPFTRAERLILRDAAGEVFDVPGADVEFDLFASNGEAYLCEVKSHIESDDVLNFHRKARFAARHLDRPFVALMIAASVETPAERLGKSLGIRFIVRSRIEPDHPLPGEGDAAAEGDAPRHP